MAPAPAYTFGAFELDMRRRRLSKDGEPVVLPDRYVDILHLLLARAGDVVAKESLVEAGWRDVAVGDNNLEQAISGLRRRLGPASDGGQQIETLARRGYRFRSPVVTVPARETDESLDAMLQPYRVFVEGRAAIETFERESVHRAIGAFREVLSTAPDYAPGHIGLANASVLSFDSTVFGATPDVQALMAALHHAREACRLDAASGEAWATFAFVLSRTGAGTDAVAAGRRAAALDPDNWRHHVRLAYAAWGDERLAAARAAIRRLPGFGLAHWLAATVHVARQAFDEAARELVAGTVAQDALPEGGRFSSVGLHLLRGLVCLAEGDGAGAERELERELAFEPSGHIYSTRACANARCALAALRLREGRTPEALAAFEEALARAPAHQIALAAMVGLTRGAERSAFRTRLDRRLAMMAGHGVDAAIAIGVGEVLAGRHQAAADRVASALETVTGDLSAGWGIAVEPLLRVRDYPHVWQPVLARLRARAA